MDIINNVEYINIIDTIDHKYKRKSNNMCFIMIVIYYQLIICYI